MTWLGRSDVTVTPVIREGRVDAVDTHDPPWWMAEQVILRDKTCRFPYCERNAGPPTWTTSSPYDKDGPPGQTNPENLAPCVHDIAAPRPAAGGSTNACPTAATSGKGPGTAPTQ